MVTSIIKKSKYPDFIWKALNSNFKIEDMGDNIEVTYENPEEFYKVIEKAKAIACKEIEEIVAKNISQISDDSLIKIIFSITSELKNKLNYPADIFSTHNEIDLMKIIDQKELMELICRICRYTIMKIK